MMEDTLQSRNGLLDNDGMLTMTKAKLQNSLLGQGTGQLKFDIIVVGAGPIGLCMALMLQKRGIRVGIFERQSALYPLPRAVMMDHETQRMLFAEGLEPSIKPILQNVGWKGESFFAWRDANMQIITAFDWARSESGGDLASSFSQPVLERVLEAAVVQAEIPFIRGVELESIDTTDADNICAKFHPWTIARGADLTNPTITASARYLIGCDGANSTVRTLAEMDMTDLGFEYDWLVVDFLMKGPPGPKVQEIICSQICDPKRPTTLALSGHGRYRLEFMRLENETADTLIAKSSELSKVWGFTEENSEVERTAMYTFRARYVQQSAKNRIILAGDAAHQLPPFIGQGVNSGFRDCNGLAWRLDAILKHKVSPTILQSYVHERGAHDLSIMLGKPICETDVQISAAMHENIRRRGVRAAPLLPRLGSPDKGCYLDQPTAGFLSRQRPLKTANGDEKTFDEIHGTGWRLIAFNEPANLHISAENFFIHAMAGKIVLITEAEDVEAEYATYFRQKLCAKVVLVRPDFYVFGTSSSLDCTELIWQAAEKAEYFRY